MMDVRINDQSLRPLLAGPPAIRDPLNGVCRTLDLTVYNAPGLENYLGQPVELWYGGSRWFFGFMMKRGYTSDGLVTYTAYDPLYYMKRTPNDWYFKNQTATQGFRELAAASGIKVASLANTGVVFKSLYYPGAEADKVAVDLLARTYKDNGKKYWYRYKPDAGSDGLYLFEKAVPAKIWAFQVGVNLESAAREESIEEAATIVKLVNRETGKVVTKIDQEAAKSFGPMVHFEEVNKDEAAKMETKAQALLKDLAKVSATMKAEGVNPSQIMPQFYSGDVIYVEEKHTGLIGAYHIKDVTQVFESDAMVRLSFDLQEAADIPVIQYSDATSKPKDKTKAGKGVQQEYGAEVNAAISKYGL